MHAEKVGKFWEVLGNPRLHRFFFLCLSNYETFLTENHVCVLCFERRVACRFFFFSYRRGKGAAFTSGVKHTALWGQRCGSEQEGDCEGTLFCRV